MAEIVWDALAERFFETGTDHGVLYHRSGGQYTNGEAWNGLTTVTASPTGAEPSKTYADNINYVTLFSAEEFGATIECLSAPAGFLTYDGVKKTAGGLQIGGQTRPAFGFSWRTNKGTAEDEDLGYIYHFAYGCQASPSEKAYTTVNDSPEALTFSWALTTTPVEVPGYKPTAYCRIDSTDPDIDPAKLEDLLDVLYGRTGAPARLPLPAEIDAILSAGVTTVTPPQPTFDGGDEVTIPSTPGVIYAINGVDQTAGVKTITVDALVTARPAAGYTFTGVYVDRWLFEV